MMLKFKQQKLRLQSLLQRLKKLRKRGKNYLMQRENWQFKEKCLSKESSKLWQMQLRLLKKQQMQRELKI